MTKTTTKTPENQPEESGATASEELLKMDREQLLQLVALFDAYIEETRKINHEWAAKLNQIDTVLVEQLQQIREGRPEEATIN